MSREQNLAQAAAATLERHIRLAILQLLAGQPMGNASDVVLYEALGAMGHPVSRDAVRAHIFLLGTLGLIQVLDLRASTGLVGATLSEKGSDVARGRSFVAGVEPAVQGG